MKNNMQRFVAIVGIGFALLMPKNMGFAESDNNGERAESEFFEKLSAQWWQWALSIPTPENPLIDRTGRNSVVGQRGFVWFLAGVFGGQPPTVTRTSSVPEGKLLYFPVINSVNVDTPNVCGQGANRIPVKDLRAMSAAAIDAAANLSVTVDRIAIKNLRRVKSEVFEIALPENNVFIPLCAPLPVPAGIYSPAVDDGIYVLLKPLPLGHHTLHFHAESPAGVLSQDVTYNLTVVPVLLDNDQRHADGGSFTSTTE